MIVHTCIYCNFETNYKYKYDNHLLTKKHLNKCNNEEHNIINAKYMCNICEFTASQKNDYNRHLKTIKHQNNKINADKKNNTIKINANNNINNTIQINANNIDNNINNNNNNNIMITIVENQQSLSKQNEELKKKIEQLEEINKQNTNKIVKEARAIKKSILTILNTNFKDTPSIEYIQEDEFQKELESEYNAKLTDKDDKLIMRIFNDYENKKIVESLSKIILKLVKKEDQKIQSVFNIDSARGNYATKIEDCWFNDKSGLQLKKYTLEMVIKYMVQVLDKFRLKLVELRKDNMKKPSMDKSDYLMKYQCLLLEVNSYLNNSNTHKKIILYMCPELRMDPQLLDSLDKCL
jgi:hypothetical protein